MQATVYSTNQTSTTANKNFLSLSSQSVLEQSKGLSLSETLRNNLFHISINMQHYKFPAFLVNITATIRLIQWYCLCFMPRYSDFWNAKGESLIFISILKIPLHLCVHFSHVYHSVIVFIMCLFFIICSIHFFYLLTLNPNEKSITNNTICWLKVFLQILTPIFACFLFSTWGFLLSISLFDGNTETVVLLAVIIGVIGIILASFCHFISFYVIRGTAILRLDELFIPWAPFTLLWASFEYYTYIIAFLEEFLPINNLYFRLAYTILVIAFFNPFVGFCVIRFPIFQITMDSAHIATLNSVSFVVIILLNAQQFIPNFNSIILCMSALILYVILNTMHRYIVKRIISRDIKKLYGAYKNAHSILPHITPVVFTSPLSTQVALSQEAYQCIQSFNSLDIKSKSRFWRFLIIGTEMRMPAISNTDFIKWGVNFFCDKNSIIICAQICEFFGENSQTQSVLLQRIGEEGKIGVFLAPILLSLEHKHKDQITDKPPFMVLLEKKASAGLSRCRRALQLFWGCVLNHSQSNMKEALCRIRDAIADTDSHFDELLRCYPTSTSAIELNLSYLTEVKGEFIQCNDYINDISAKLIEKHSDQMDDDGSSDGMQKLLNDQQKPFYNQIKNLGAFMEQERHVLVETKAPIIVLMTFTVLSLFVILASLLFVIFMTLTQLNKYPKIVEIIKTLNEIIIDVALLTFSSRRLCLFANDRITVETYENDIMTHPTSRPETILPFLIEKAESYSAKLKTFYEATTADDDLLNQLYNFTAPLNIYGRTREGSIAYLFDLFGFWTKSIAANLPRELNTPEYSMTNLGKSGRELNVKTQNYWEFIHQKKGESLRQGNFDLINHFHEQFIQNVSSNDFANGDKINVSTKSTGGFDYSTLPNDMYKNYSSICSSASMKELVLNIGPLITLVDTFMNRFYIVSNQYIDNLDTVLYWSMIVFPVAFIIVFGIFLIIVSVFIKKEAAFRNTLYLSLPEQVASEIFRSGGNIRKRRIVEKKNDGVCEIDFNNNNNMNMNNNNFGYESIDIVTAENQMIKEKALQIESLQQFSAISNGIQGTGINHFIAWMCIYLILSACSLFALTFYARTVNNSFHSRSMMICYAALRFAAFEYAGIHIQEFFYFDPQIADLDMNATSLPQLIGQAQTFITYTNNFEKSLTFGDENITSDFREYSEIAQMYLSKLPQMTPNFSTPVNSISAMVHSAYPTMNFNTRLRVFMTISKGILNSFIDGFTKGELAFRLNDDTWKQFNHYMVDHLEDDIKRTASIYIGSIQMIISSSFTIALIISIASLVILLLIFLLPIVMAVRALRGYFRMTTHVLCQIPPTVFERSMYINKWLKNQITRTNYHQFETYYKRTVSASLQSKIISESPEKLLLFNSSMQFLEASSLPLEGIEDPTLEDVLSLVVDSNSNKTILEEVQHAMMKFQDSKDNLENVVIVTQSIVGSPLKLTITGITTSDTSFSSTTSIQRYYAFIAILVRDITSEASQESQYIQQKERTIALLSEVLPRNFAIRMHDGERRISFSAGIGAVLSCEVINYGNVFAECDPQKLVEAIVTFRSVVNEILADFENVSILQFLDGKMLFIAGLFNDEQNGRTEAIDTIQFAAHLNRNLMEIFAKNDTPISMRYGICTGGPIFCKLLMDSSPVCLVSGETVTIARQIMAKCQASQLLLERTTYECIYGMNIDCQIAGEIDFNGKHTSLYAAQIDKISDFKLP